MGSEKLQKRISDGCSNNLPEKWTLSSKESRTATDTAISPDGNTVRMKTCSNCAWRRVCRFCTSAWSLFVSLCVNLSENTPQETRSVLELRCLSWLPAAMCCLFSSWNVTTPNWDILIVQNKHQIWVFSIKNCVCVCVCMCVRKWPMWERERGRKRRARTSLSLWSPTFTHPCLPWLLRALKQVQLLSGPVTSEASVGGIKLAFSTQEAWVKSRFSIAPAGDLGQPLPWVELCPILVK